MSLNATMALPPSPLMPRLLANLVTGTLAVVALLGFVVLVRGQTLELSGIQVEGRLQEVAPAAVREVAAPYLTQGFWNVDVEALRDDLAGIPWVARARVERRWPSALRVTIWERSAYARWNNQSLLDVEGVAFTPAPDSMPEGLPKLSGPAGQEQLVKRSFERLASALKQTPFPLAALNLDARGEWSGVTLSGVELRFGQDDPAKLLPLLQGAVADSVRGRLAELHYIDLRYTNGFAVGWQKPRDKAGDKGHG